MVEAVGVKFRSGGRTYYFLPNGHDLKVGQYVIVETVRGLECGKVAKPRVLLDRSKIIRPLKPVVRTATQEDLEKVRKNEEDARKAFSICRKLIPKYSLPMRLVKAEYTFDRRRLVFYFVAEEKVDFRELVRELARIFKTRIELIQIGPRDAAKLMGWYGLCGRPTCCSVFLGEFKHIPMKLVKAQSVVENPMKISGPCGRLICCLRFELDVYKEKLKKIPPEGSVVRLPDGRVGKVVRKRALEEVIVVRIQSEERIEEVTVKASEVKVLQMGRKSEIEEEKGEEKIGSLFEELMLL